jgi:hypothetical protein
MDGVTARKAVLVGSDAGVLTFAALLVRLEPVRLDDGRYSPGVEMFGAGADAADRRSHQT